MLTSREHNIMVNRRGEGVKPDKLTAEERQELLAAIGGKPFCGSGKTILKKTLERCVDHPFQ